MPGAGLWWQTAASDLPHPCWHGFALGQSRISLSSCAKSLNHRRMFSYAPKHIALLRAGCFGTGIRWNQRLLLLCQTALFPINSRSVFYRWCLKRSLLHWSCLISLWMFWMENIPLSLIKAVFLSASGPKHCNRLGPYRRTGFWAWGQPENQPVPAVPLAAGFSGMQGVIRKQQSRNF